MVKTDCLFIHVPQVREHSLRGFKLFINYIAIGVFSMCNELFKNKFKPQIIHLGVEKSIDINFDVADYVKKNKIKLVGISLHWHYQTYDALKVAQKIKEKNPKTVIFLGGIMSSAFADDFLKQYHFLDAVIKGEGEKSVVELARKVHTDDYNWSSVTNLHWRKDNKIIKNKKIWFANENELNSFNFDGLKFLKNYKTYLEFPFIYNYNNKEPQRPRYRQRTSLVCCLGRGCPGNCTWCGGGFEATKIITGRDRITLRDPKITAKEFIQLKKQYDIGEFYICFDPFPNNQEYLYELFDILGKKMPNKINITFECFGLPSKRFIDSLKKNLGADSQIVISPEFGNEELRNKHRAFSFSNKDLMECIKYLQKVNIKTLLYFSTLPFETETDDRQTRNLINEICNNKTDNIEIAHQTINDVEPFSPLAMNPEKYCITVKLKTLDDYVNNSKCYRDLL